MFEEASESTNLLAQLAMRAIEAQNDYPKFISITRLFYHTLEDVDQKDSKHIKKLIDDYDLHPEEQRTSRQLAVLHTDPQAIHEYLTDGDPKIPYEEELEIKHHKNIAHAIQHFGQIIRKYGKGTELQP